MRDQSVQCLAVRYLSPWLLTDSYPDNESLAFAGNAPTIVVQRFVPLLYYYLVAHRRLLVILACMAPNCDASPGTQASAFSQFRPRKAAH